MPSSRVTPSAARTRLPYTLATMGDFDGVLAHSASRGWAMPRAASGGAEAADGFETVLLAAKAGAPWASAELWNAHAGAVAGFLRARGSAEPDDLTSEVFLAVFDGLDRFEGGAAEFRAFVFTIAYRRLVDELRRRARQAPSEEWADELDPRRAASAEDEALGRIGDAAALATLDGLPPDQRDVMVLRIIGDLTVEQVAAVLGKRAGAVKALQRRALTALRKKFPAGRTPAATSGDSRE